MHQINILSNNNCHSEAEDIQPRKRSKIDYSLGRLFRSYLGLVTEDNIPLKVFKSPNLSYILDLICKNIQQNDGEKLQFNEDKCSEALHLVGTEVRDSIKRDLKMKMLSVKVNASKFSSDNIYIISVHYIQEDAIRSIILGMVKLEDVNNSSQSTLDIILALSKYDIVLSQIVSITIEDEQNICRSSIKTLYHNDSRLPFEDIEICSCAARTAHLCSADLANNSNVKENLNLCRSITESIRNSRSHRDALEFKDLKIPQVDCANRVGSTYEMVSDLHSAKNMLIELESGPEGLSAGKIEIPASLWDFIDAYAEAAGPLQRTILKFQEQDLHYGQFYAQWLKCKLSTQCFVTKNAASCHKLKYDIGTTIVKSMENREITNECLLGCLFLDPRFHRTLNQTQRANAIQFLRKMWDKICFLNSGYSVNENRTTTTVEADAEDQLLDKFLSESIETKCGDKVDVYTKIECLQLLHAKSDTDVLAFWRDKKIAEPELYALSNICFAIPPTQVMSNSIYESLKSVLDSNRSYSSQETLDNILLIKLNPSYLDKAVVGSLPLFQHYNEDTSNEHNDTLLVYEDAPSSYGNMTEEDDNKAMTFSNYQMEDGSSNVYNNMDERSESSTVKTHKKNLQSDIASSNTNIDISIKTEVEYNDDHNSQHSNMSYQDIENSACPKIIYDQPETKRRKRTAPNLGKESWTQPRCYNNNNNRIVEIGH